MGRVQSKFATQHQILSHLKSGSTLEQSAAAADVAAGTVRNWRKKDRNFDRQVRDALDGQVGPAQDSGTVVHNVFVYSDASLGMSTTDYRLLRTDFRPEQIDLYIDDLRERFFGDAEDEHGNDLRQRTKIAKLAARKGIQAASAKNVLPSKVVIDYLLQSRYDVQLDNPHRKLLDRAIIDIVDFHDQQPCARIAAGAGCIRKAERWKSTCHDRCLCSAIVERQLQRGEIPQDWHEQVIAYRISDFHDKVKQYEDRLALSREWLRLQRKLSK